MILSLLIAACPAPPAVRVTCVHDGDTIVIERERMRIVGIDAPELRGRCTRETRLAIRARVKLIELLNTRPVTITRIGYDRYGRTLVEMPQVSLAMIEAGLAQQWRGRKANWC